MCLARSPFKLVPKRQEGNRGNMERDSVGKASVLLAKTIVS